MHARCLGSVAYAQGGEGVVNEMEMAGQGGCGAGATHLQVSYTHPPRT